MQQEEVDRRVRLSAALLCQPIGNGTIIKFEPTQKGSEGTDFIPIALSTRISWKHGDFAPAWCQGWFATHWPSNCDGCYAAGLLGMLLRYDASASSLDPSCAAIAPLLWPEQGWSELAMQTIWLAAMCKSSDVSAVAKDALIEGVLDARAQPHELARHLVPLLRNKWLKLNRLADALNEVVQVSNWSTLFVTEVLDAVVQSWQETPRDGHLLLTLLLEGMSKLNSGLSPAAVDSLKKLKATGKSAKVVAQLLKLQGSPASAARQTALLEGVDARIRRAQWCVTCASH